MTLLNKLIKVGLYKKGIANMKNVISILFIWKLKIKVLSEDWQN